jgi:hypothetical protein
MAISCALRFLRTISSAELMAMRVSHVEMHKGTQEGVLKSVFCVFAISGNAIRRPEKSFRVRVAQSIESCCMSAFCGSYQMEFRRWL